MLLTLFLLFCSLDAFDGDCTKYEQFVELDGVEIANTDELGISRVEGRSECSEKCLETDTCLGLIHIYSFMQHRTHAITKRSNLNQDKLILTILNKNYVS